MRLISLALALGLVAPAKSEARSRSGAAEPLGSPPPEKQPRRRDSRRLLQLAPMRSPCGRHVVEIDGGAVFVDGRRVHPAVGTVALLSPPTWRADGDALAWLERRAGETRLVVVPVITRSSETIVWPLPSALANDRVHWAGDNRVVVGPEALHPRAVASWE